MKSENDKVQCLLCKEWFGRVTEGHLNSRHNLTTAKYRKKFPDARTVSSESRRKGMRTFLGNMTPEEREEYGRKKVEQMTGPGTRMNGLRAFKARATKEEWEAHCKNLSEKAKARFRKPSERKKASEAAKTRFKDPEQRKGISERATERYKDPSERKKLSDAAKARFEDPSVRERLREIGKARFANMTEEELQAFIKAPLRGKRTSRVEARLVKKLVKLGFEVKAGYKLGRFLVDAFLPEEGIVVELYGDYWHTNPERYEPDYVHPTIGLTADEIWKRDCKRVRRIEKMGYRVVIVWEHEMKFLSSSDLKRKLDGNTEPSPSRKTREGVETEVPSLKRRKTSR